MALYCGLGGFILGRFVFKYLCKVGRGGFALGGVFFAVGCGFVGGGGGLFLAISCVSLLVY